MNARRTLRATLAASVALLVLAPGFALAQPTTADLEKRIADLEAALASVRADLAEQRAADANANDRLLKIERAPAAAPAPSAPADGFRVGQTTIKIGGYVKGEALFSDYSDGDTATNVLGRDFYLPSSIPVGAAAASEDVDFDAHAKQTRIALTINTAVDQHKLGAYVEGDFQSAPGTQGSERTTNAWDFALRRAYVTFDNWLFGQDWSTFMNAAALPESTDFIGPTDGTIFDRQALIRYTRKLNDTSSLVLSLENAETAYITPASATLQEPDDDSLPDAVARYNTKFGKVDFSAAAIVRQLSVDTGAVSADETSWGLMVAGKAPIGAKDDLRFSLAGGDGIGRYIGLNLGPDAVLAGATLSAVSQTAGFIAYRHYWTDKTRSTLSLSGTEIDAPTNAPGAANKSAYSVAINLFTSPVKGLDLGIEYRHGERETVNGQDGALDRVHMIAKHSF
jgi:hypothetical protein